MSQTFTSKIKIALTGAGKASKKTNKLSKGMDNLAKSALRAGAAFFAGKSIIDGLKKSVQLSTQQIALSRGFDALTSKMGMSAATMKKLQAATDGTVNSIDLMKAANQAMTLGVVDSEEGMAKLFDTAQRLGKSLGVDTVGAIDSLVTGMGRQSILMLDNLGIIVDTKKAQDDYAASINKTSSQLTDQEKKIAFNTAALTAAEQKVKDLGDEQLDVGDSLQQSWVKIEESMADIGTKVVPILADVATFASNALEDLQGLWDWATGATPDSEQLLQMMKDAGMETEEYAASLKKLELLEQQAVVNDLKRTTQIKDRAEAESMLKRTQEMRIDLIDTSVLGATKMAELEAKLSAETAKLNELEEKRQEIFDKRGGKVLASIDYASLTKDIEQSKEEIKSFQDDFDAMQEATQNLMPHIGDTDEVTERLVAYIAELEKLKKLQEELAALEDDSSKDKTKKKDDNEIKRTKLKLDGMKKLSKESVNAAMAIGASQQDAAKAAGAAATAFILAELQKAIAIYITDAFQKFGIWGGVLGAASSGVVGNVFSRAIKGASKTFAAEGMDEIVTEPTLIVAGEAGAEYVNIEPTTNEGANRGGGTIVFQGNVLSDDFIIEEAIPKIRQALQRGESLGIS